MGLDLETIEVDFEYNNFMTIKKRRTKKNVFYCYVCLNRNGTFQILCSALNNDVLMFFAYICKHFEYIQVTETSNA